MTLSREEGANAALNYLAAVEERFRDVPDNYDLFLEYMGQYNHKE
jgi:histone deacetylase complex regulatory component SIN3